MPKKGTKKVRLGGGSGQVSKVSVQLAPLFLVYGEAEHHSRRGWWSRDAHLMAARKQRKRKGRGQTQDNFKDISQ